MNKQIFVSLFIATLVAMLGLGIIAPVLPLYAKSLGAAGIELGMIFAGFALSRGILAPIIGEISDRHGRKKLMILGLILLTLVSVAFVYAGSALSLTLIRVVQGFASVLITPVAQAYIGDLTPVGQEGKYQNLFFMSFFAGQAAGPGMGGYMSEKFGLTSPFVAMAGLSLLALCLVVVFVPESAPVEPNGSLDDSVFGALRKVFMDKPLLGIMAYMSTRGFYRWGFNAFFPLLAVKVASMSVASVGIILSVYMLSGSLVQYPVGLLVDRYPMWKVSFILVGGIASALLMCAVAAATSMTAYILLTLGMGVFSAVSRASAIAIRTERGRVHGMGAATGASTASFSAGQIFGPIAFGAIADVAGIPVAFVAGGVVGLAGTLVSAALLKSAADQS